MSHLIRPNTTLPELFDKVRSMESNADKLFVLRQYNSRQLSWFVNATYNFDFSDYKIPKHKKGFKPPEICYLTLNKAINRIEAAVTFHQNGNIAKYEDLMNLVLEGVSAKEAELLEDLFNNKKIEGISKSVWKELYPKFFRTEEKTETNKDQV